MSVYISVDLQRKIRRYFRDCCAYCRTAESLTAMTFEIEHIFPVSRGGETAFENLCLACPSCNRHKASRVRGIDPQTNTKTLLFHPHKQDWAEHFLWVNQGIELQGLSDIGRTTIAALMMNRPALIRARAMWVKLREHPPDFE